jgi:hypothetical protein
MITYETENHIILCPKFKIFSQKAVDEVTNLITKKPPTKDIAIDMSNVYSISDKFLEMINTAQRKFTLLNTPADILVIINLTNSDKNVKLFTNNIDLEEDKRELRNRKFSIV